jgi:hypothetical protein
LEVVFRYTPAVEAKLDDPPEGAEVEILSLNALRGREAMETPIAESELAEIERQCANYAEGRLEKPED